MATITLRTGDRSTYGQPFIVRDDGRSYLATVDYDYPGIAGTFGWDISSVEETTLHPYSLPCEHRETDGTIACPSCMTPPSTFIAAARDWIAEHDGATADDPGYFDAD